jgi:arylsulfatase A-like enzyme
VLLRHLQWDAGMATRDHLPTGRGYDSSLHYFHHANDFWSSKTHNTSDTCPHDVYPHWPTRPPGGCFTDLWDTDRPAIGRNASVPSAKLYPRSHQAPNGTGNSGAVGYSITGPEEHYEEHMFKSRVLSIIAAHDAVSQPLFMCYCFHTVHEPLQAPNQTYAKFASIVTDDYVAMGLRHRTLYASMVNYMDGAVGDIVEQLHSKAMWNHTLLGTWWACMWWGALIEGVLSVHQRRSVQLSAIRSFSK